MEATKEVVKPEGFGATARRDAWWIEPMLVAIGFGLFIVYATFRVFENNYYEWGPYLSPFFSPKFMLDLVKMLPPAVIPYVPPAAFILWIPAGFRATCYYYRKAYYRAYFADPPGCSVSHFGGDKYCGETSFPFILQNLHRYFFYLATIVLAFLWYDAIIAFNFDGHFGVGVGSLVLLANVILLSCYSFGCHAWRHLVGGRLDCFSCTATSQQSFKFWEGVTKLNEHHMFWAWCSLFSVGFADFYVRSVASGLFTDIRLF